MTEKSCNNCGAKILDGMMFCTLCGKVVSDEAEPGPGQPSGAEGETQNDRKEQQFSQSVKAPEIKSEREEPARVQPPMHTQMPNHDPHDEDGGLVTTWGFVGIHYLMMIPIVNLVLLIIWACGGSKKKTKTNFARAQFLVLLINIVAVSALIILLHFTLSDSFYNWSKGLSLPSFIDDIIDRVTNRGFSLRGGFFRGFWFR